MCQAPPPKLRTRPADKIPRFITDLNRVGISKVASIKRPIAVKIFDAAHKFAVSRIRAFIPTLPPIALKSPIDITDDFAANPSAATLRPIRIDPADRQDREIVQDGPNAPFRERDLSDPPLHAR